MTMPERDLFDGKPLDADILGHRLRYSTHRLASSARFLLKRLPGAKAAWHYLYFTGRRRAYMRRLPSVPRKLKLELTNACNLRCVMCPNSTMERRRGLMSWELFTRVVDEAKEIGVPHLGMYSTGESLIHPRFCDMVDYAKDKGLYVSLCTNAQLLTEEHSRRLLDAGLDCMRYSFEGTTKEYYESIRRGGTFERLLSNIATFKRMRDARKAATRIQIESVYFGEGFERARQFREFFAPYADQVFFYPACNMGGGVDLDHLASAKRRPVAPAPCINLWTGMCITWDGKATLCNYDFEAETAVGDLWTSTLKDLWHSPRYQQFRRLHLTGRQQEMPLCGSCSDISSQPNAIFKPFLVNEQVVRPCLKTSFEAFVLNDQIERYCARKSRGHRTPPAT